MVKKNKNKKNNTKRKKKRKNNKKIRRKRRIMQRGRRIDESYLNNASLTFGSSNRISLGSEGITYFVK